MGGEETVTEMTTINSGDPVEVQKFLMGGVLSWVQGYVFVRFDGLDAIVQPTKGIFKGCNTRYQASEVRASSV